jgi:HK97 gp10 family phage protein
VPEGGVIDVDVKLSGDLISGLDTWAKKIQDEVVLSGVAAMARVIYDEVKLNTSGARGTGAPGAPPKKGPTGNLHDAIYRVYVPERSRGGEQVYKVSVNKSKAPHWHLIEYGTVRAAAHPYIRPAWGKIGAAIEAGKRRMSERMAGQGGAPGV